MSNSKELIGLLVGSHFVPPSKLLLENLPQGTKIRLLADPENPYDQNAIKVLLPPGGIPVERHEKLAEALPAMGWTLEDVLGADVLMLGHLAASDGKPLQKVQQSDPQIVGNKEFLEAGLEGEGELLFDGSGMVLIRFRPKPSA